MSLPSKLKFFKNNQLVKEVFCNCGWWWDYDMKRLYENTLEELAYAGRLIDVDTEEINMDFEWDEVEAYGLRVYKACVMNEPCDKKYVDHLNILYRNMQETDENRDKMHLFKSAWVLVNYHHVVAVRVTESDGECNWFDIEHFVRDIEQQLGPEKVKELHNSVLTSTA